MYYAAKSLQSCLTLCDPIDGSPPGSPVPGILQARTLEWVDIFLLQCMKVKSESEVAQLCLPLSDPMDCSLLGTSVHGIFQARVLEGVASAFSGDVLRCLIKRSFFSEEWIKKWYIYTVGYYPALKNNKIMPSAVPWLDLDIVMLSEVNQI